MSKSSSKPAPVRAGPLLREISRDQAVAYAHAVLVACKRHTDENGRVPTFVHVGFKIWETLHACSVLQHQTPPNDTNLPNPCWSFNGIPIVPTHLGPILIFPVDEVCVEDCDRLTTHAYDGIARKPTDSMFEEYVSGQRVHPYYVTASLDGVWTRRVLKENNQPFLVWLAGSRDGEVFYVKGG